MLWPSPLLLLLLLLALHADRNGNSVAANGTSFGDLVAVGAISLLRPPPPPPPANSQQNLPSGRLVDRIAAERQPQVNNKLDYIVEFMRQNKLTKFCDILTDYSSPEIKDLNRRLNGMSQFTLFVPTNEALLLMPSGQLEQIVRHPEEARQFLLAHATGELVIPKLDSAAQRELMAAARWSSIRNQQTSAGLQAEPVLAAPPSSRASTSLFNSLAGTQLRITTAPLSLMSPSASTTTKLELIVNGANVLSGHSHALQEPNNTNLTYAIVHLIDKSLYPPTTANLMDKLRSLSPRMAKYIQMAGDSEIDEVLESSQRLSTLLLPSDDSLRTLESKLAIQLDTNRTFLVEFLRNHLIDGLHYSIQLVAGRQQVVQLPQASQKLSSTLTRLTSFANSPLEFEQKLLPSRRLVLVNSIPILEPDIMAINGVVHLISRPILAGSQLMDCKCGNTSSLSSGSSNDTTSDRWSSGSTSSLGSVNFSGNELEREESQLSGRSTGVSNENSNNQLARVRSERSGNLIERNNRDFYRPSAAPMNLQLVASGSGQPLPPIQRQQLVTATNTQRRQDSTPLGQGIVSQGVIGVDQVEELNRFLALQSALQNTTGNLSGATNSRIRDGNSPPVTALDLFEAERYKVLNATTRRQMREQQQEFLRNSSTPNRPNPRFSYDQPLSTQASNIAGDLSDNLLRPELEPTNRRLYSAVNATIAPSTNVSSWSSSDTSNNSNLSRRLMLKFQPEDARDLPASRMASANNTRPASPSSNLLQPSYDILNPSSSSTNSKLARQQQLAGKTVAPPVSFGGCAFYDAECKRLVSRLVRLPPTKSTTSASNLTSGLTYQPTANIVGQHLDSTFGETTESPQIFGASPQSLAQNQNRFNSRLRVSPLNQPLPPWGDDQLAPGSWRAQDPAADITRISLAAADASRKSSSGGHGFTTGLSRDSKMMSSKSVSSGFVASLGPPATNDSRPQILLVPMRLLQGTGGLSNATGQLISDKPIYFSPPLGSLRSQQQTLSNFMQFQPPTPTQSLGRLTNFTALETVPQNPNSLVDEDLSSGGFSKSQSVHFKSQPTVGGGQRKQRLHQIQAEGLNGSFGGSGNIFASLNPTTTKFANPAATKRIVQLQPTPPGVWPAAGDNFGGDISVTSAQLSAAPINYLNNQSAAGNLATQASDRLSTNAIGGGNFVRSVPLVDSSSGSIAATSGAVDQSADFFQNRTIAEIMDDSGLRIDGQQVTFSRLKECLRDADLLSLVVQTGNSLTIFMPTDLAFQRLVQQQVIAHQRERNQSAAASSRQSVSARLLDPSRRHLIPLVARARPSTSSSSSLQANQDLTSGRLTFDPLDANSAIDRLSLDCSTNQVRQLLLDHLSARLVTPKQLLSDTILSALSGHQLLLSSVPSKKIVVVDGQPVIAATRAKNGMVYVVNKFLNLTHQMPNVIDLIETQPNLTTFLSYLTFSSLVDRLKRETGPITVLAPTNEAFEQLSPSARQLINSDPAALLDILRGHIVEGAQFGKLISMRSRLRTLNGDQNIEAKVIKPNVYQLDNQMTSMRLVGTTGNGVVNTIDRLIVPPWLKVSMGAKPTSNLLQPSGIEIDTSLTRDSGIVTSSPLNLPPIGRQPVGFEPVAGGRLTLPSATIGPNSFLLANGNSNRSNNVNSNLLAFDNPSTFADFDGQPLGSSAFVSNNAQVSASNGGQLTLSLSRVNVTKNMQLIEKLANLMQARKFVKYLLKSKISNSLKPDMNYVILVPTDQAIEKLPKQIIDMLDKDADRLADLVNYHVLDTTFEYINTIPDGQTLNTLNEKDILFNWHRNNTILTASGAVVLGGIQEENIALLIVDRVLYPTPGDILNIISKSPILSNFTALVRQTGLEKQLSLAGPYTLFAPSDFAFNQLDKRDLEFLQRNRETARRFLLRHLSQPAIFTSSIALSNTSTASNATTASRSSPTIVPTMTISNSLGEELTLRQRNDYFSVNDVNFSYADVAATNGVVHVIDGLL